MAWVVGLANEEEIGRMEAAGYEVHRDIDLSSIVLSPEGGKDISVAIPVDCNCGDLLDLEPEYVCPKCGKHGIPSIFGDFCTVCGNKKRGFIADKIRLYGGRL